MAEWSHDYPNELGVGVDLGRARADFLARNLRDENLRRVIGGFRGGALLGGPVPESGGGISYGDWWSCSRSTAGDAS